jgi:hypothetical protein
MTVETITLYTICVVFIVVHYLTIRYQDRHAEDIISLYLLNECYDKIIKKLEPRITTLESELPLLKKETHDNKEVNHD